MGNLEPDKPLAVLDDSECGSPTPPELYGLTTEPLPLPQVDPVAVAAAAIGHLEFKQALAVVVGWYDELSPPEQQATREAIRCGGAAAAGGQDR
jgi:hypothetical protein